MQYNPRSFFIQDGEGFSQPANVGFKFHGHVIMLASLFLSDPKVHVFRENDPHGMFIYDADSVEDAITWILRQEKIAKKIEKRD